ncbi:MAG: DUF2195 family protein [Phyllobacterium sp.]
MHGLIQGIVLFAILCGAAAAADTGNVTVQNELAACVTVKAAKTVTETNTVSVFQFHKSIGDCGRFSARVTYTSSVDNGGVRDVLQQGVITIKNDGTKALVLASEPTFDRQSGNSSPIDLRASNIGQSFCCQFSLLRRKGSADAQKTCSPGDFHSNDVRRQRVDQWMARNRDNLRRNRVVLDYNLFCLREFGKKAFTYRGGLTRMLRDRFVYSSRTDACVVSLKGDFMDKSDNTPAPLELLKSLQTIFPTFGDAELLAEIETGDVGLHGVMRHFTEYFGAVGQTFTKGQLRALGRVLDQAIVQGGELENAVSTCFLEHLYQIKSSRILLPFVSQRTKERIWNS